MHGIKKNSSDSGTVPIQINVHWIVQSAIDETNLHYCIACLQNLSRLSFSEPTKALKKYLHSVCVWPNSSLTGSQYKQHQAYCSLLMTVGRSVASRILELGHYSKILTCRVRLWNAVCVDSWVRRGRLSVGRLRHVEVGHGRWGQAR